MAHNPPTHLISSLSWILALIVNLHLSTTLSLLQRKHIFQHDNLQSNASHFFISFGPTQTLFLLLQMHPSKFLSFLIFCLFTFSMNHNHSKWILEFWILLLLEDCFRYFYFLWVSKRWMELKRRTCNEVDIHLASESQVELTLFEGNKYLHLLSVFPFHHDTIWSMISSIIQTYFWSSIQICNNNTISFEYIIQYIYCCIFRKVFHISSHPNKQIQLHPCILFCISPLASSFLIWFSF